MRPLITRTIIVALLLVGTLAAAFFFFSIDRNSRELLTRQDTLAARVRQMTDAVGGIGTAQQSYVAPGQLDEPWFERMSSLVQQLNDDVAAVRPLLQSPEASTALQGLADSIDTLIAAEGRTRQNLSLGQDLMAADVIFSDGRNILDAMIARLREMEDAERASIRAALASLSWERWIVLGLMIVLWGGAVGFMTYVGHGFTPRQAGREGPPYASGSPPIERSDTRAAAPVESPAMSRASVDLAAAAALCTDLSRVTDTAALSAVLDRATSLLDAAGLMLWMSAGEQLFAVTGHGYPPETIARFGPIPRPAENAAAAAWRTGRLTVVPGDYTANGALVAPMFGPNACIGVLALEIRQGREQDPAIQAVAVMIAAQLATAVSAWPAASLAQPAANEAEAQTA